MNKTIVKMFALLLVVFLLAVPVFAGGDQQICRKSMNMKLWWKLKNRNRKTR